MGVENLCWPLLLRLPCDEGPGAVGPCHGTYHSMRKGKEGRVNDESAVLGASDLRTSPRV